MKIILALCTQKKSLNLINFFGEMQEDLRLSKEHLNILNCFLDPAYMIKEEETPISLNPNAYVFDETNNASIMQKEPSIDEPKRDPIWEFFNTDEGMIHLIT